jgi:hypothetical protein
MGSAKKIFDQFRDNPRNNTFKKFAINGKLVKKPSHVWGCINLDFADKRYFRGYRSEKYDRARFSDKLLTIPQAGDSLYSGKGDSTIKIFKKDSVYEIYKYVYDDTVNITPYPRTDIKK